MNTHYQFALPDITLLSPHNTIQHTQHPHPHNNHTRTTVNLTTHIHRHSQHTHTHTHPDACIHKSCMCMHSQIMHVHALFEPWNRIVHFRRFQRNWLSTAHNASHVFLSVIFFSLTPPPPPPPTFTNTVYSSQSLRGKIWCNQNLKKKCYSKP